MSIGQFQALKEALRRHCIGAQGFNREQCRECKCTWEDDEIEHHKASCLARPHAPHVIVDPSEPKIRVSA